MRTQYLPFFATCLILFVVSCAYPGLRLMEFHRDYGEGSAIGQIVRYWGKPDEIILLPEEDKVLGKWRFCYTKEHRITKFRREEPRLSEAEVVAFEKQFDPGKMFPLQSELSLERREELNGGDAFFLCDDGTFCGWSRDCWYFTEEEWQDWRAMKR